MFPSAEDFWETFPQIGVAPGHAVRLVELLRAVVGNAHRPGMAGVKVLLDGQGGDEVFGGYAKFRYAYLASLLRSGRLALRAGPARC